MRRYIGFKGSRVTFKINGTEKNLQELPFRDLALLLQGALSENAAMMTVNPELSYEGQRELERELKFDGRLVELQKRGTVATAVRGKIRYTVQFVRDDFYDSLDAGYVKH